MILTPSNFSENWAGSLNKLNFSPSPFFPSLTSDFLYYAGLPSAVRLENISFKFNSTAQNLIDYWNESGDPEQWVLPFDWRRFWHIGNVDYDQADAWVCIEEVTGRIVTIDIELEQPFNTMNSSIFYMAVCIKIVQDWNQQYAGDVNKLNELLASLSDDDVLPQGEAKYYWINTIKHLTEMNESGSNIKIKIE